MNIQFLGSLLALTSLGSLAATEEMDNNLRFAKILNDNVVLQQGKPITVWGWAKPGVAVKVTLTQNVVTGHKAEAEAGLETTQDDSDDYAVSVRYLDKNPPRLKEKTLSAKAGKQGRWSVSFLPAKASSSLPG